MNKAQALYQFWSGFGLPAYEENIVPVGATMPYITYQVETDSIENVVPIAGSLWYRTPSWKDADLKAEEIGDYVRHMYPPTIKIDGGRMYIVKGTPFAQHMSDTDNMVRRIYINLNAEYLTE